MDIQFLGSGDAFGSGGRFNTCIHVTSEAGAFLIDCGALSLIAMRKFGIDPNSIGAIVISHLHGDHFGGLPFLLLDAQFYSARRTPLTLVGPPGLRDRLALAMEVFFPGSSGTARKFTTETIEMEAGKEVSINGVRAVAALVQHASGAPPFALRLALGELASTATTGQRVLPRRALALGYRFRFPELGPALAELLG
jgi:ribonuclease BN (tRNA processing enzyme)